MLLLYITKTCMLNRYKWNGLYCFTGTTWSNETVQLQYTLPELMIVPQVSTPNSPAFMKFTLQLGDTLFQWLDMTEEGDIKSVVSADPADR